MLPGTPPTSTVYSTRRGSIGWPVYALQAGLNDSAPSVAPGLAEDGDFGPATEDAVKRFQRENGLTADGIAGPATQGKVANIVTARVDRTVSGTPLGLLRGLVLAESGNLLAAVNWSVPGGVDCGLAQRRVYSPYSVEALRAAFSPYAACRKSAQDFDARRDDYLGETWVGLNRERAGRCAALAHNWPAGAASQAKYGHVSSPNELASWVPAGVRFPDGTPVRTRQEWAQFYALGGPHGEGNVTRFVTSW